MPFRILGLTLLAGVRCGEPLVATRRSPSRPGDRAAVDDARRPVQAQACDHCSEVPGVHRAPVDGGLAAHGPGPGPVEGRQ